MNRDTSGVNLHVGRIGKVSALAIALKSGCTIAPHSVGGEEVGVAVSASGNDHSVGREALKLAADEVLGNDTACTTVDNHEVFHFVAGEELHTSGVYLTAQRRISTEEKLLACLTFGIEST